MTRKSSSQKDIELPLLSKHHRSSFEASRDHLLESQTPLYGTQKYLDINVLNRMLFIWITTIVHRGNEKTFQQDHHYNLRDEEDTYCISQKFSAEWRTAQGKKYALLRTQYQAFKPLVLTTQALAALQTMLDFTGPVLVARIIMYMSQEEQTLSEALLLIVIFIISRIGIIIVNAQCQLANTLLQNRIVAGTKALVYKKFLKFPLIRNKEYSSGKIMNLMLVDIENIAKIFFNLPQLFQFPFILFLGIYFIYAAIGLAFIGGVISVVVVTVTVSHITKILFRYQHLVMEAKDERMKKTNEVMTGIKYIKMCGIEDKFTETVSQSREKELAVLKMKQIFHSFRIFSGYLTPVLLVIAVFGCYILFEGELTAEKAFVVLATLVVIQKPINWIGQILNDVLLGQVSLGRVQDFMYTEEIDTSIIDSKKDENDDIAVKIKNGNFSWTNEEDFTKNPENLILKNLNLQINKGSFVAILGDVGSGKSSLFNCMMGEMLYDKYSPPSIRLNGSVAYVAQKPWIINATVKDNILFGSQFDKNQYSEALRTSCLQSDLKILIKKDETEIGEKGVNLSGGQKARVALARAIYANKDIYLLDDPLSAVDAHVGKYILEECLTGQLKEKTRILVTHKIESLRYVDYIYIFKAGNIVAEGSLEEIRKTPFYQEIEQNATKEAKNIEEAEEAEEGVVSSKNSKAASEVKEEAQKRKTTQKQSSRHEGSIHEGEDQKEMLNKLMLDEDRKVGAIGLKAWFTYLGYLGGSKFWVSQTGMLVVWILLKMGADFWLAHWSNASTDDDNTHSNGYYYGIYTAMGVISASSLFSQTLLMFLKGNDMSRKLHTEMFTRIIRAPLNLFFDRVPLGRLINRFASDLDMVDNTQIQMLTAVSHFPLNLLSRFVVCAIAGTLWVFPLALFFLFVGFKIQRYYLNVYREAFRLNRISSSPVTSTFAESLDGLTQIRVSNYQNKFLSKYAHRQNENMKNQILVAGLQGWFNFHINAASLLIIGPTVAFAILSSRGSSSASGLVGLLLTYLLDLSNTMIMTLQILSNFESQLIAFERCKAFTNVEVESAPYTQLPVANYTGESWPENGQIEIKNYYAKYRPNLPFVIKDLSIRIKPSEKIGVVGRTGSGKSTTLLCLLRIIESKKGQILIDDVDISQLGLDDLRRKITIIPQDPLLYKGSVRSNLDLFNQYSDMEVWGALEKVCMRNKFITTGLESEIKEGGENLSAGEKQLVCIARAILSKSRIILIDEATSSIDNVTEEVILQSIHDNFKDCTMITIAHRLKTIIGSDKILFMENGRAVEFDSPHTLMNNRNGHFYKLWKEYENAQV